MLRPGVSIVNGKRPHDSQGQTLLKATAAAKEGKHGVGWLESQGSVERSDSRWGKGRNSSASPPLPCLGHPGSGYQDRIWDARHLLGDSAWEGGSGESLRPWCKSGIQGGRAGERKNWVGRTSGDRTILRVSGLGWWGSPGAKIPTREIAPLGRNSWL